ncbi:hypothetical protein Tco_0033541 [Tanacetum coccineum]
MTNHADPDIALELGKSISLIEAEEEEAARKVHATHARIVTESIPEPTRRKPSGKVTVDPPKKLKSVLSLTLEEQEAADTMKALKESRKTRKRQPGTGGSNEGTGSKPGVPDESTIVFATSSEGTGAKPGVPDEEKVTTEEKVILEWGDEQDNKYSDDDNENKSIDLKLTDDEETEDEFVHRGEYVQTNDEESDDEFVQGEEQVHDDEDEEMPDVEVANSDKGNEEVTDAAKADAKKTSEVKDDAKKTKLPLTSLSLSVSSGFGDQFLKLSSDTSLVGTVKDTIDATINSLLEVKIQSEVPHIQSPSMLRVPVFVISEPSVLTPVPKTPLATPVTTLPPPSVSTIPPVPLQQQTKAPIPTPQATTESPIIITVVRESNALICSFATLNDTHVSTIVDDYLGSKLSDALQKALQKHTVDLAQKHYVKPTPELRKIKTPTINLEQEYEKSTSDILMIKRNTILGVKSVKVEKLHRYGHLDEIMVKRADQQLYTFKECDFVNLHLNDIEDMLLLAVQHKLFHLNESDIVDLIVALRMFTRSLIVKRQVEDLQHGVEKLYTPSYDPPGAIYEDQNKQKRVMRADELYNFSDGTL